MQHLEIADWLPDQLANSSHGHWRSRQRKLRGAQLAVWTAAKIAGWTPVVGRAKLTITLVFAQHRRRDVDNLYSRCKGVVDGIVRGGWITDDSADVLDLEVQAEVSKEWTGTRITLEALGSAKVNYV